MIFRNEAVQKDWVEFSSKVNQIFDKSIKPVLREQPTSDIAIMVHKLEFLAGWSPFVGEKKAKGEYFMRLARAQALQDCPIQAPELKVKIWIEGETAEVEHLYNFLESVYEAMADSGQKLQSCLKIEMALLGMKT